MATTTYVVLYQAVREANSASSIPANTWIEHASVEAGSAEEAIKSEADAAGAYVAIPARSFKRYPVKVETQRVVKLG